jgi:hypothetical protein
MSTFNLLRGNFLVLPKFDILLFFNSGRSIFLDDKYARWFFLFSVGCSGFVLYNMTKILISNLKLFINNLRVPSKISNDNQNRFVLILGFGDTNSSISITKFFSKLGYNILAISEESILDYRRKNRKDEKEGIDKLSTKLIHLSYEDFLRDDQEKLRGYQDINIEFLFECSLWRETSSDEFISNEENSRNFNFDLIQSKISDFFDILNKIKMNFSSCKFFSLDYYVKYSNINHKLLSDFKYDVMNNFLFNNKKSIESLSRIKIRNKFHKLSELNFEKVYLNYQAYMKHQTFTIE